MWHILCNFTSMKPFKYIFFALFLLAVLPAKSGDIRMGIAPNPANSQVRVTVEGTITNTQQHPEIFTLLGEKVSVSQCHREGNSFIINTYAIPNGIYVVRYGTADQFVSRVLTIQH
ncbi:MAG: T9SS C-terminal target domain-containing protein [Bacteroidetes bacterium]|nr:T9SS C-terminal target domain-containing protein [Bacteroidota bacterium]